MPHSTRYSSSPKSLNVGHLMRQCLDVATASLLVNGRTDVSAFDGVKMQLGGFVVASQVIHRQSNLVARRRPRLVLAVAAVASLIVGCSKEAPLALPQAKIPSEPATTEAVATVAGEPITTIDLGRALVRNGAEVSNQYEDVAARRELLDDLIETKLLAVAGRRAGYDKDPEVVAMVDRMVADRYLRELVAANPGEKDVKEEEQRAYYEAHRADFTLPDRVRASIILLRFPLNAQDADKAVTRERAATLLNDAKTQKDLPGSFVSLAREHSQDLLTRDRGGDLGWLPRGARTHRVPSALLDALFKIEGEGNFGPLVETDVGVYVVRLTGLTVGQVKPYEEVAADIRQILLAEKSKRLNDERYRQLSKQFEVKVDEKLLAAVKPPAPPSSGEKPPAFPIGPSAK